HFLLIHGLGHGDQIRTHQVANLLLGGHAEELEEGDDAEQVLIGVEHVGVVQGAGLLLELAADVTDRLLGTHLGAHARVARVHEAAGVVLGVGQQSPHVVLSRLIELSQHLRPLLLRHVLQEVGGVVGGQDAEPDAPLPGRQVEHEVALVARAQAQEEVVGLGRIERSESEHAILGVEQEPGVSQILEGDAGASLCDGRFGHGNLRCVDVTARNYVTAPCADQRIARCLAALASPRALGYSPAVNAVALALATGLGSGFFPLAPATFASALVTLVVWLVVPVSPVVEGLVALALVPVAVWSAHQAEKRLGHDAHPIVVDEVLGQWIALWAVPRSALWMGAGFLLFRFFDIATLRGVYRLQSLAGGWGIVADDALAGVYARLVLGALIWIVPLLRGV